MLKQVRAAAWHLGLRCRVNSAHTPADALKPTDARQISICAAAAAGDLDLVKFYISGTHGQAHSCSCCIRVTRCLQGCLLLTSTASTTTA